MIIAMPMSRGRLAGHFTKAQRIGFFNEYHHLVTSFDNPALAGGCSAKKAMLNLIKEQKADIVMVKNIGERMLGKLLDAGISVSQGDNTLGIEQLLTSCSDVSLRLLNASEGRASLHHLEKGGCCGSTGGGCGSTGGGCGCGDGTEPQPLLSKTAPDSEIVSATLSVKINYAGFRPIN